MLPVGCWKLAELCFDFDQSFVRRTAGDAFRQLAALRKAHPGAPLALFGHADPVGDDDYNKKLSEERAKAIYAVLARKPEIWGEIYDVRALQTKLDELGHDPGPVDGIEGPRTQAAIRSYMDELCGELTLEDSDFLGNGTFAFQGCSEFNPLRMMSSSMKERFEKDGLKRERDLENRPNRRTVGYLFSAGTRIEEATWPCPSAADGVAACKEQFWPDADQRRTFQDRGREFDALGPPSTSPSPPRGTGESESAGFFTFGYEEADEADEEGGGDAYEVTNDTFACCFYEGLARVAPCERPSAPLLLELLLGDDSEGSMVEAEYRLTVGEDVQTGSTREGWLVEWIPRHVREVVVEWRAEGEGGKGAGEEDAYAERTTFMLSWADQGAAGFGLRFDDAAECSEISYEGDGLAEDEQGLETGGGV